MTTIKVSKATGPVLDWLVATCEGLNPFINTPYDGNVYTHGGRQFVSRYTTAWAQSGLIIEREKLTVQPVVSPVGWVARTQRGDNVWEGPTPLIAALRCYVASKLGDTAEVPKELI